MSDLMKIDGDLAMSSMEIASLVEKRHDNVRRTMDSLRAKGLITVTQVEEPTVGGGKPTAIYLVGKRDSYVVVAQLSPEFTARLVDRWQELENERVDNLIPQSFADALRLAADLEEQKVIAEIERDKAIETKAQISRTREATAMGRLGAAVKKITRLEKKVGDSRDYKSAKSIDWLKDFFNLDIKAAYSQIGKALSALSKEMGKEPQKVESSEYGSVKIYHFSVIREFEKRVRKNPELLKKYRKEVMMEA